MMYSYSSLNSVCKKNESIIITYGMVKLILKLYLHKNWGAPASHCNSWQKTFGTPTERVAVEYRLPRSMGLKIFTSAQEVTHPVNLTNVHLFQNHFTVSSSVKKIKFHSFLKIKSLKKKKKKKKSFIK